jgi:beta-glucosidase
LLKNKNAVLPMKFEGRRVSVFGKQADETLVGGGGSGQVHPSWKPSYLNVVHATVANAEYGTQSENVVFVSEDKPLADLQAAAVDSDVCIFFTHAFASEGNDRENLSLEDDWYVGDVAPLCKESIAVVTTPGAILLPWRNVVDAIVVNWYPGVAGAFALMDVLRGDADPSGRLPITFPQVENQEGMTTKQYPGSNAGLLATYSERWDFGYRFYHAHNEEPAFWFGSGLSYSDFSVSKVQWKERDIVTFSIKNIGSRIGKAVPQLYVRYPDECNEPLWSLRGFEKVELAAGEERTMSFALKDRSFSIYDVETRDWQVCAGLFSAAVGLDSNVGLEAVGQNKAVFKVR